MNLNEISNVIQSMTDPYTQCFTEKACYLYAVAGQVRVIAKRSYNQQVQLSLKEVERLDYLITKRREYCGYRQNSYLQPTDRHTLNANIDGMEREIDDLIKTLGVNIDSNGEAVDPVIGPLGQYIQPPLKANEFKCPITRCLLDGNDMHEGYRVYCLVVANARIAFMKASRKEQVAFAEMHQDMIEQMEDFYTHRDAMNIVNDIRSGHEQWTPMEKKTLLQWKINVNLVDDRLFAHRGLMFLMMSLAGFARLGLRLASTITTNSSGTGTQYISALGKLGLSSAWLLVGPMVIFIAYRLILNIFDQAEFPVKCENAISRNVNAVAQKLAFYKSGYAFLNMEESLAQCVKKRLPAFEQANNDYDIRNGSNSETSLEENEQYRQLRAV